MVWWYIILLLIFVILMGLIYDGVRDKNMNILEDEQVEGVSRMITKTGRCKCFSCE